MFNKLKEYFSGEGDLTVDKQGAPTARELKVAAGVILLHVAGADDDYAPEEVHATFRSLEKAFDTDEDAVYGLLQEADKLRECKDKIDGFIDIINENFDDSQKKTLFGMLWQVVIADGKVDKFEKRYANQIQARLKLSDELVAQAKKETEKKPVD